MLRGFALFGIVLVNVAYFATDPLLGATGAWLQGWVNALAGFLVWTLVQGKFYLLFAFLFGYSAPYLVHGDRARRGRWRARTAGLILLGLLHVALLWHGDILFAYEMLALPLGALFFRSDASLRRWAWGSYLITASLQALLVFGVWVAEMSGEVLGVLEGTTPPQHHLAIGHLPRIDPRALPCGRAACRAGCCCRGATPSRRCSSASSQPARRCRAAAGGSRPHSC